MSRVRGVRRIHALKFLEHDHIARCFHWPSLNRTPDSLQFSSALRYDRRRNHKTSAAAPTLSAYASEDFMSDETGHRYGMLGDRSIAEALARKTNKPIDRVAEIYARESAALERTARVKNFIGVLATRRTRVILDAGGDE